jgi:hypothetical protein
MVLARRPSRRSAAGVYRPVAVDKGRQIRFAEINDMPTRLSIAKSIAFGHRSVDKQWQLTDLPC